MKRVTILAVEGCMASGVIGLLDILTIANACRVGSHPTEGFPFFHVDIATPTGESVNSFNLVPVMPQRSIDDVESTDIIIIPPVAIPLPSAIEQNRSVFPWLKHHHERKAVLASVCTGAFFIAETGLLDGRPATTNQSVASQFEDMYPEVELNLQRIIVDNGDTVCAGSTYSFRELVIYLIERYCDHETAVQVSKMFLIDKNRSSQAPYLVFQQQKGHEDKEILDVQEWLESHYSTNITADSMAGKWGMSKRSFSRRFKNATGDSFNIYLQRLRIEAAKTKLESTRDSFDEITSQVGYEDSRSFSRLFKKATSLSPRAYRQKFAAILD